MTNIEDIHAYLEWRDGLKGLPMDTSPEAWEWSKAVNRVIGLVGDERRNSEDIEGDDWHREMNEALDAVKRAKEILDGTSDR